MKIDERPGSGLAELISKPFYSLSPNLISLVSIVFAALAGYLYFEGQILLFAIAVIISAGMDAIDGQVARHTGKASKKGDLIDHVLDRYSDIFIILGIALSAYGNIFLGMLAMEGILMTSYMGTQAQALSAVRDYGGVAGRANRLLILIVLGPLQFLVRVSIIYAGTVINVTNATLILFFILGNATALYRFSRLYHSL